MFKKLTTPLFNKLKTQQALAQNFVKPALAAAAASSSIPPAPSLSAPIPPRAPGNWWNKRLDAHLRFHQRREANEQQTLTLRTRDVVYMDIRNREACAGDRRLNNLQYWLNNLGVQRSPDQQLFHKHFINACLPKIYGSDWNANSVRVMRSLDLQKIQYEVTAITPRRWGKTWSVALYVLALMLACPGIRVCVFSTGKRASGSLMEIMMQFMGNVEGLIDRVVKQNQEELYISGAAMAHGTSANSDAAKSQRQMNTTSKLFCYPCSVTGKCHTVTLHTFSAAARFVVVSLR